MDIPEIKLLVCRHLGSPHLKSTRNALASCVRVCKDWHEAFAPLLYSKVDTSKFSADISGGKRIRSLNVGLRRHGHHITELSVKLPYSFLDALATSTCHIRNLSITGDETSAADQETLIDIHGLRTLLDNNSGIAQLSISQFYSPNDSRCIGQIIQFCPQLRCLNVEECRFDLADLIYLDGFLQLSKIYFLESVIRATGGPLIRTPSLPALKHIDILEVQEDAMPAAFEMITSWSRLESLNFSFVDENYYPQALSIVSSLTHDALRKFQLSPFISDLKLSGIGLTDRDLSRVLDGCPALRDLYLWDMDVGEASVASLLNISGTLTNLALVGDTNRRYWTPRLILCSFPKLVEFRCSILDIDEMFFDTSRKEVLFSARRQGRHMEQIGPGIRNSTKEKQAMAHLLGQWTCTRLRQFQADTLVLSLDHDRNLALIDQLAMLRRITEFAAESTFRRVIATDESDYYQSSLTTRKGPKMDGAVKISRTSSYMTKSDLMKDQNLQWICSLWPKIRSYRGPCQIASRE